MLDRSAERDKAQMGPLVTHVFQMATQRAAAVWIDSLHVTQVEPDLSTVLSEGSVHGKTHVVKTNQVQFAVDLDGCYRSRHREGHVTHAATPRNFTGLSQDV